MSGMGSSVGFFLNPVLCVYIETPISAGNPEGLPNNLKTVTPTQLPFKTPKTLSSTPEVGDDPNFFTTSPPRGGPKKLCGPGMGSVDSFGLTSPGGNAFRIFEFF